MKLTQPEITNLAGLIAEKIKPLLSARWIKLKDAAIYSSIGKSRLKKMAESGEVIGFQDQNSKRGDWIFDKNSLDEYMEIQSGQIRQKALELLGRV